MNSVEAHADEITIVTEDIQDVEAPENNFIKLAIQIDVVDNGNGLTVRDTEILSASDYTSKKKVGSGLGLFIARRLAKRGGGFLFAPGKQPRKGAHFRIILPVDSGDEVS